MSNNFEHITVTPPNFMTYKILSVGHDKDISTLQVEHDKITARAAGIKKEFSVDRVFDQESTQGVELFIRWCLSDLSYK
ncbi:hypothetical protein GUJ93_ZPchr0008g13792 [Zizania palustris]|uniref:Uncharacterized protein n=1 Tax=Zizania palustris TaxID=103762 RepID=A0A8J5RKS5_ZIZPA|nr:hypothetical protein GUJ93_ZPchr0008g13792 [Zizania palustris]